VRPSQLVFENIQKLEFDECHPTSAPKKNHRNADGL